MESAFGAATVGVGEAPAVLSPATSLIKAGG